MRTLADLCAHLEESGVELSIGPAAGGGPRLLAEAPDGVLTAAMVAELSHHRDALLAVVGRAFLPDSARSDPRRARMPDLRRVVALWPDEWRRIWGCRANEREDRGEPWDVAERRAFLETAPELAIAEDRGEVPEWSYPDPTSGGSMSDAEAVAAIDRTSGGDVRSKTGG